MNLTKEKHATHTPGPWQIEDCTPGESTGLRFEVGTKDSVIARTTDGWKEARANARLIAAAPEMYEVLSEVLIEYEAEAKAEGWDLPTTGEMIREVLAKVEGGEG
jgi:hypothetical protein